MYYERTGYTIFYQDYRGQPMICCGSPGYYDYCILLSDGKFIFGNEQTRQGGHTLTPDWHCGEYWDEVKIYLSHIKQYAPDYYESIAERMTPEHKTFLEQR